MIWPRGRRIGSSADDDGRGPAVISDGYVFIVRQKRVIGAEEGADVGRVVHGSVEIGVVADCGGEQHGGFAHGHEARFDARAIGRAGLEQLGQTPPQLGPGGRPRDIRSFSDSDAQAAASAGPSRPAAAQRLRSRMWPPMATPMDGRSAIASKNAERKVLEAGNRFAGRWRNRASFRTFISSGALADRRAALRRSRSRSRLRNCAAHRRAVRRRYGARASLRRHLRIGTHPAMFPRAHG